MPDENVRAGFGDHVHVAHIDIREHGFLLLHEEMDDAEENDGVGRRAKIFKFFILSIY